MIRRKLIRQTVSSLLNEAGVSAPIVDVKAIAQMKGALVVEEPIEKADFSGFLYRTSGSPPIIGVNSKHSLSRKRFTIAHELGHMLLHPTNGVHVDEAVIQMRDSRASEGTDEQEIESNRFAAELLMPREFLEADFQTMGAIHADDEDAMARLAKRYGVSPQAMAIRLSSLELVWM